MRISSEQLTAVLKAALRVRVVAGDVRFEFVKLLCWCRLLLADPRLLVDLEKPRIQEIPPGSFTLQDHTWEVDWVQPTGEIQVVRKALIHAERLHDLKEGTVNASTNFSLQTRTSSRNAAGSLKRPKADAYLLIQRFCCSFGPKDLWPAVAEVQDPASKPAKGKGSRRQRTDLGQIIKRGYQFLFGTKQLCKWPDFTKLTLYSDQDCDKTGHPCHGSDDITAQNTRAQFCPKIPSSMQEWVTEQLRLGPGVQKIMSIHNTQHSAKLEKGSAGHKYFLFRLLVHDCYRL